MAKYELRYMFEWADDSCIWTLNQAARERYGINVDMDLLPISTELRELLKKWCFERDGALDEDYPPNPYVWNEEQQRQFREKAKPAYDRLCEELGPDYSVAYQDDDIL